MGVPSVLELFVIVIILGLPTYLMIKSDITIDKTEKIPLGNKLGTVFMLLSAIGTLYFLISIFFIKKVHPSKKLFLQVIFALHIIIIAGLGFMVSQKISEDEAKREKIISNLLNTNSKLPIMINNEMQIVKYSSPNNKTIIGQMKLVNYSKNEILAEYSNSISNFETEMLNGELKISCPNASLKNIFATGIEMNIEYFGKDNQIIGTININDEKCKPYY